MKKLILLIMMVSGALAGMGQSLEVEGTGATRTYNGDLPPLEFVDGLKKPFYSHLLEYGDGYFTVFETDSMVNTFSKRYTFHVNSITSGTAIARVSSISYYTATSLPSQNRLSSPATPGFMIPPVTSGTNPLDSMDKPGILFFSNSIHNVMRQDDFVIAIAYFPSVSTSDLTFYYNSKYIEFPTAIPSSVRMPHGETMIDPIPVSGTYYGGRYDRKIVFRSTYSNGKLYPRVVYLDVRVKKDAPFDTDTEMLATLSALRVATVTSPPLVRHVTGARDPNSLSITPDTLYPIGIAQKLNCTITFVNKGSAVTQKVIVKLPKSTPGIDIGNLDVSSITLDAVGGGNVSYDNTKPDSISFTFPATLPGEDQVGLVDRSKTIGKLMFQVSTDANLSGVDSLRWRARVYFDHINKASSFDTNVEKVPIPSLSGKLPTCCLECYPILIGLLILFLVIILFLLWRMFQRQR
ncbi:MAG: hypothetical protein SF053_04675 [Bacteroidia bacterium]|nr:hypothetical protein [Bacteroidia bacterium]